MVACLDFAVEVAEEEACRIDLAEGVQEPSISDDHLRLVLAEVEAVHHDSVGRRMIV